MQTAPTPAQGTLVMAPVSPAVAKLLHALQAQIIKEAAERQHAPEGEIQLPPPGEWHPYDGGDGDSLSWFSENSSSIHASRRRTKPASWHAETPWHPAWFTVNFHRYDAQGRGWQHYGGDYVTDDFGTLVPVSRSVQ